MLTSYETLGKCLNLSLLLSQKESRKAGRMGGRDGGEGQVTYRQPPQARGEVVVSSEERVLGNPSILV